MCLHVFPTVHALRIHQRSSILHRTCVFCGFLAKTPTLLRAHSLEHCTTGATSSAPVPGVPLQSPVAGVHPRDPISSPATTLPHVPAPTPTPTPSPPPHVPPPPASTTPYVAPFGPLRAFLPPSPPSPPPPPHTPAPWAPAAELFSCAVHVCRPREDLFQLFVFVKQDRTIALDVGLGDTVETVKAKIQDKEGIPSEQQHLVFGAIVLQDGRTLADYDVSGGCMLDLSFRFVSTQRWPQAFPVILHNVQCVCSFLSSLSLQDKASRSNIRGVSCVRVHAWTSTHRGICGVCCRHRAGTSSSSFRLSPLPPSRSVWG